MAGWNDVRRIALALPETSEQTKFGQAAWCVRDAMFVWERPLRRSDLEALGEAAPKGPILGVRVPSLLAKEALLASRPKWCFTTPHFNGYPAVLVRLDAVRAADLEELIVEAWLARAPKRVASAYVEASRPKGAPDRGRRRAPATSRARTGTRRTT